MKISIDYEDDLPYPMHSYYDDADARIHFEGAGETGCREPLVMISMKVHDCCDGVAALLARVGVPSDLAARYGANIETWARKRERLS